jgi:predicted AAA+ superfamily ATPase
MEHIQRLAKKQVLDALKPGKVVVLLGARRVGKTVLLHEVIKEVESRGEGRVLFRNGEDLETHEELDRRTARNYRELLAGVRVLVIDEAQTIPDIGLKLKLMIDSIEGLKILVTGSSVFDLENRLGEPLVGRATTVRLFPLAQMELGLKESFAETTSNFEGRIIYGGYPELEQMQTNAEKEAYLSEQIRAYLLRDLLAFEGVRKRSKIVALLQMIAFRVGSEISVEGLSRDLGMHKQTVERYLDLLSKVFILFNVRGFSRNLDNEITKKSKWYFYDNGIRNAMIRSFNPLELRDDHGQLWENYLVSERLKFQSYTGLYSANFFWRTHAQQEIDWIEDRGGQLHAFEFKWKPGARVKTPSAWSRAYPAASFELVDRDNYRDFIC